MSESNMKRLAEIILEDIPKIPNLGVDRYALRVVAYARQLAEQVLSGPTDYAEARPPQELCADDAHLFRPCQACGMPYLASRLEPPTDDDIAWAKRVVRRAEPLKET